MAGKRKTRDNAVKASPAPVPTPVVAQAESAPPLGTPTFPSDAVEPAAPVVAAKPAAPVVVAEAAPSVAPVAKAVAIQAASVVEDVVTQLTETVAAAVTPAAPTEEKKMDTTTKAQAMFGDMSEKAKAAMAKSQTAFAEMNEFNKGNVEALVESGKIAATGLQSMGQEYAEFARKSFENTTSAFKGMAQVKSPTELAKLHSDYVRGAFDMMVAETSRSTEAMMKLAGAVVQPISNRMAVAVEKVKIAA